MPLCRCFVENRARTYALFTLAEDSHARPSALVGVDYPWVALDFDRAIYLWGNYVRVEVERAKNDVREGAARAKQKLAPQKVAAAAEQRFNELVLGRKLRTLTLWSVRNNCPIEITEELRVDPKDGQERWVRLGERLDQGRTGTQPALGQSM